MTVSIVVGGQYGSEGKGKVAHWLAHQQGASMAIRVGGANSGHTVDLGAGPLLLRQIPTPCLLESVIGVIPAGFYIDEEVLQEEISALGIGPDRLLIHPDAVVVDQAMKDAEREQGLGGRIGSTVQGVGVAVARRAMREPGLQFAATSSLKEFVRDDLCNIIAAALATQQRIILEGTQGFGLSLLHSGGYPHTTSRDTTAAGVLSEVGISPLAVDCIVLVLRAFPIRVGGNSGDLPNETTWDDVTRLSGSASPLTEYTSVTGRIRRIARFDSRIVQSAIRHNLPTLTVLNHVDYFDYRIHGQNTLSEPALQAVLAIEGMLSTSIDVVGTGPVSGAMIKRPSYGWVNTVAA